MNKTVAVIIVILAAAGILTWYFWPEAEIIEPDPLPQVEQTESAADPYQEETDTSAIDTSTPNTVAETSPQEPPPRTFEEADTRLKTWAGGEEAERTLPTLSEEKDLVRRMVSATEAAWRNQNLVRTLEPFRPGGNFKTQQGEDGKVYISEENFQRYEPMVNLISGLDTQSLVDHYYLLRPLVLEAYGELGNGDNEWDKKVEDLIQRVLRFQYPEKKPALIGGGGLYVFEDPKLENLPPLEKLLIRIGPRNTAILKKKFREFRTTSPNR